MTHEQGDLIPCSLSMTIYLYDALLKNPDPETWSPTNNPEWTSNSGRVVSGTSVGSRQYFKYKIPLCWTMISEEDTTQILQLVEDGADYFPVEFYHRCVYIDCHETVSTGGIPKAPTRLCVSETVGIQATDQLTFRQDLKRANRRANRDPWYSTARQMKCAPERNSRARNSNT